MLTTRHRTPDQATITRQTGISSEHIGIQRGAKFLELVIRLIRLYTIDIQRVRNNAGTSQYTDDRNNNQQLNQREPSPNPRPKA